MEKPLRGVYPILTTVFDHVGEFDEDGQRHAIEFLINAQVDGLVTCANASEGTPSPMRNASASSKS